MTVKTRSSANYSHHVPTMVPATTNHTAFTTQSSSFNDITNAIATTNASVNVDAIMASKNEANQKFLRSYEAHLKKKFVVQARQWLTAFKYTSSEVDEIIASFNLSEGNIKSKDDASGGDGCAVFSPVKKKQKSNDYTATTSVASQNKTNKNHKVLLPPNVAISQQQQQQQHSILTKYGHVAHGLSIAELERIESLKKNDLISEIKVMGGEYHKSWTKPILLERLLRAYATFRQPTTQFESHPVASSEKSELREDDGDVVMASTTLIENDSSLANADMARTKSADNNINMKCQSDTTVHNSKQQNQHSDSHEASIIAVGDYGNTDDRMSVSSIPAQLSNVQTLNHSIIIIDEDDNDNNNAINDNTEQLIKNVPINDSDEMVPVYESAREKCAQSQSEQVQQHSSYNAKTLTLKKHNNVSNIETKTSFMVATKPPQKSRVSPTTVPPGIVDSAKKSLLMSSQKKKEPYLSSNVQQQPPVGRLLYNDARWTTPVVDSGHQVEHQKIDVKCPITTAVFDVESMSSNTTSSTSNKNPWTNRILSTPAYNSNGTLLGMSQKVQASKEARHAQVARMKEKSKQTLPQKAMILTSDKKVPDILQKSAILSNTERIRLHQQMQQQSNNNFSISTPSVTGPSQIKQLQSSTLQPTLVDTVKSKPHQNQNQKGFTKTKSPIPLKPPEYTNYEMTDGEYDSDDDEDDVSETNTKIIPDWARSKNLEKALEIQFSKEYPIDPDVLFGEVETCNLEAIFGKRTSKYRNRNSSGDWTKDRVTSEEKRRYKLLIA